MKTETIITLTRSEAIAMLLKTNPNVTQFIIEDESDKVKAKLVRTQQHFNRLIKERKFINISRGFSDENITHVAIDVDGKAWRVYKSGVRNRFPGLILRNALDFVAVKIWKEIP
jgi:hypothetical protein